MRFFNQRAVSSFLFTLGISLMVACGGGGGSTPPSEPVTLSAPYNVNATDGLHADRVVITWNTVSGAASYRVYRSASSGGTYEEIGNPTAASYNDTTVTYQADYYYKVSAIASDSKEGTMSQIDSGYSDTLPSGITGLSATNGTYTDKVAVSWNYDGNPGNTYEVTRSEDQSGPYLLVGQPSGTSFEDTTVVSGKSYYFRVRGLSSKGTPGNTSGYDNGYANLVQPTGVTATNGSHLDKVDITWNSVSNASTYKVYRSTAEGGTYDHIATVSIASASDASTTVKNNPGKNYYYKVAGVSADLLEGIISGFDCGYVGLNKPSNVAASDGKHFQYVKITWTGVTGASSYKVYRDNVHIATPTLTNYNDATAASGTTYAYAITAIVDQESAKSDPDNGSIRAGGTDALFTVSWNANKEKSVNRSGGGYRVYYSQTSGFDVSGASYKNVPYVSGAQSPVSTTLAFTSAQLGTWYVKVVGYSDLNGGTLGQSSAQTSLIVE